MDVETLDQQYSNGKKIGPAHPIIRGVCGEAAGEHRYGFEPNLPLPEWKGRRTPKVSCRVCVKPDLKYLSVHDLDRSRRRARGLPARAIHDQPELPRRGLRRDDQEYLADARPRHDVAGCRMRYLRVRSVI